MPTTGSRNSRARTAACSTSRSTKTGFRCCTSSTTSISTLRRTRRSRSGRRRRHVLRRGEPVQHPAGIQRQHLGKVRARGVHGLKNASGNVYTRNVFNQPTPKDLHLLMQAVDSPMIPALAGAMPALGIESLQKMGAKFILCANALGIWCLELKPGAKAQRRKSRKSCARTCSWGDHRSCDGDRHREGAGSGHQVTAIRKASAVADNRRRGGSKPHHSRTRNRNRSRSSDVMCRSVRRHELQACDRQRDGQAASGT